MKISLVFLFSFFLVLGCSTYSSPYTASKAIDNDEGIYEGTYTRTVPFRHFVDGKTGKLFTLTLIHNDNISSYFIQEENKAQQEALAKGNLDYSNITHVKVRGKVAPLSGINRYGYVGTIIVDEVLSVRPVQSVIPPDCFKTGVPCSSDGMTPYKK